MCPNLPEPIQPHLDLSELIRTYPYLSKPIQTNPNNYSQTNPNNYKPIQTITNISKPVQTLTNLSKPTQTYPKIYHQKFLKNKRLLDFRQVSRVDELTDSLMSGITSCLSWLAATIRFARQQQNATRFLLSNCFPTIKGF